MSQVKLTYDQLMMAMSGITNNQLNSAIEVVSLEGMRSHTKDTFKPKFVGIALGDNGEIERTPTASEGFGNIQSTYITAIIDRPGKDIKKAIMKNAAPKLYQQLLDASNEMVANGGVFPEFEWTGKDIQVGNIIFDRMFYIPNTTTKSGWSEDKNGNPVPQASRPFVYFPDFEDLQTIMRREARNLEYNGHYIDSTKPAVQIPVNTQATTPVAKPVVTQTQQAATQPVANPLAATGTEG